MLVVEEKVEVLVVREDSLDLTATIRHIRQDEDQSLNMTRSLQSMEEVDQAHSMVDQAPCEDHHMAQVVMAHLWETQHSMPSTSSTTHTCSSRPSTTLSMPCSYSSTMHSMVGAQGILLNRVTCPTSLLPHPAMLQEHLMGTRAKSKQPSEYL